MENLSTSDYQNDQMIVYDLVAKTNVTRSKDTRGPQCHARGVYKLMHGSPSFFYPTSTKFGVNIGEWSLLNNNLLDFRFVFAL